VNLRLFSAALLVSALPALADPAISLNKGDFIAAEKVARNGETVVSVKLSKSGKAKFKKLNKNSVNKEIHSEIAGVSSDFKLREPIHGDGLEMGPYTTADAQKIVFEINQK
jgi:preprotein translocase subunit SecD